MAEEENTEPTEVEEDETQEEGGATEWSPPSKEEFEKVKRTAEARKADMAKLRKELGELKAKAGKTEESAATVAASQKATKRIAGMAALVEAGLTRDQAKDLVAMMKLDEIDVDEDGDGDFEDEIERLKKKFPPLFGEGKKTAPRISTKNRGNGGGKTTYGNPALDAMMQV